MVHRWAVTLVAASLAACAGSSKTSVTSADVTAYDDAAAQLRAVVDTYRADANGMAAPGDCAAALARYSGDVQPLVDRMQQMASRMDEGMRSMAHATNADMTCGVSTMRIEVEQHRAVACASGDVAANRAEALRHCDAMAAFDDHLRMRGAEMGELVGMGSGMMGGSGSGMPMMDGGMPMDGGWPRADGGVMDWDHAMPGCAYGDGGFVSPDGGYWADG